MLFAGQNHQLNYHINHINLSPFTKDPVSEGQQLSNFNFSNGFPMGKIAAQERSVPLKVHNTHAQDFCLLRF